MLLVPVFGDENFGPKDKTIGWIEGYILDRRGVNVIPPA